MRECIKVLFLAAMMLAAVPSFGQDSSGKAVDTSRDARNNGPTADNQSNAKSDRQLTASIRRAVVDDKSLSTTAHNVKIISRNGEVTLRGRVRSEDEKRAVVAKAEEVAGKGKVTDQLRIASGTTKESHPDK